MPKHQKTIDLHLLIKAELDGTTIKSIQKEEVISFPYHGYVNAMTSYLNTEHHFTLFEKVEHPTDKTNIYYHQLSIYEAIEKGYQVRQFLG